MRAWYIFLVSVARLEFFDHVQNIIGALQSYSSRKQLTQSHELYFIVLQEFNGFPAFFYGKKLLFCLWCSLKKSKTKFQVKYHFIS